MLPPPPLVLVGAGATDVVAVLRWVLFGEVSSDADEVVGVHVEAPALGGENRFVSEASLVVADDATVHDPRGLIPLHRESPAGLAGAKSNEADIAVALGKNASLHSVVSLFVCEAGPSSLVTYTIAQLEIITSPSKPDGRFFSKFF